MYELMGKYGLDIFLGGTALLTPRLFKQEVDCFQAKHVGMVGPSGRGLT